MAIVCISYVDLKCYPSAMVLWGISMKLERYLVWKYFLLGVMIKYRIDVRW